MFSLVYISYSLHLNTSSPLVHNDTSQMTLTADDPSSYNSSRLKKLISDKELDVCSQYLFLMTIDSRGHFLFFRSLVDFNNGTEYLFFPAVP